MQRRGASWPRRSASRHAGCLPQVTPAGYGTGEETGWYLFELRLDRLPKLQLASVLIGFTVMQRYPTMKVVVGVSPRAHQQAVPLAERSPALCMARCLAGFVALPWCPQLRARRMPTARCRRRPEPRARRLPIQIAPCAHETHFVGRADVGARSAERCEIDDHGVATPHDAFHVAVDRRKLHSRGCTLRGNRSHPLSSRRRGARGDARPHCQHRRRSPGLRGNRVKGRPPAHYPGHHRSSRPAVRHTPSRPLNDDPPPSSKRQSPSAPIGSSSWGFPEGAARTRPAPYPRRPVPYLRTRGVARPHGLSGAATSRMAGVLPRRQCALHADRRASRLWLLSLTCLPPLRIVTLAGRRCLP